ncbi:MAG: hypothetical protein D6737_06505 [Chloroflexi bacterium]|nr:MAG: hypothetical protein D6737_06505 [Chloroflexota bacterium]
MPIEVNWLDNQQTIICLTFHGRWNVTDLRSAYQYAHQMIETRHHQVDFVLDLRDSETMISAALSFFNQLGIATAPLNRGATVVVGDTITNRICYSLMLRLHPIAIQNLDWQFATSVREARHLLSKQYA